MSYWTWSFPDRDVIAKAFRALLARPSYRPCTSHSSADRIASEPVVLSPHTTIIFGRNDTGKTAILYYIDAVLAHRALDSRCFAKAKEYVWNMSIPQATRDEWERFYRR